MPFSTSPCDPHLVHMIQFEVFEQQQQQAWDGLDNDFFVPVDINA